jgi:predicted amidohydrolase YtcJ
MTGFLNNAWLVWKPSEVCLACLEFYFFGLELTFCITGMTIEPAYASFTESSLGSIIPGKRADYVVLSQNIMEVPVNQILATRVIATVINGKPVYGHI